MTTTTYRIDGFLKHSEEDIFASGCQPGTEQSDFIEYIIDAESVAGCIEKAARFIGISEKSDICVNAYDEPGRIDFQTYEDAKGRNPSPYGLAQWKDGKKRLWLCTYTAELLEVRKEKLLHPAIIDDVTL